MKKWNGIIMLILCTVIFAGCTKESQKPDQKDQAESVQEQQTETEEQKAESDEEDRTDINIAALKGPTAMGMVKVMEDAGNGEAMNNYQFQIFGMADEISAGLAKGEIDIAAIPCNLASVLYNNTKGKVKVAGINTLSVLYILETGDEIQTVEDLRGKTIYSTGLGTTPQYTLNYLLKANGIDPEKDVTIEYKSEATEVAALLSQTEDAIAMLPQPYVTTVMMNNDKARIALDIGKEWGEVNDDESNVVTGVVVVRRDFLEKNPEAVKAFMKEYEASTTFVDDHVPEAAQLIEKFDIFKAAVAKKAIPYCNITLIQGEEMKGKVNGYLDVLFQENPKSIGGALPEDDFYYIE